jgi:hypothetical protein
LIFLKSIKGIQSSRLRAERPVRTHCRQAFATSPNFLIFFPLFNWETRYSGCSLSCLAEEGIPFKDVAAATGRGLGVPVVSKPAAEAEQHFGWFAYFVPYDLDASSQLTQDRLGWRPTMPSLLSDPERGTYFWYAGEI